MSWMSEWKAHLRQGATALSLVWAAGCFGGLINWLFVAIIDGMRILELCHVHLHSDLSKANLYRTLAVGGLWGAIFLFTIPRALKIQSGHWQFWLRAFIYGLVPALVLMFIILPHDGHGTGGVAYGNATPAFVLLFNTVGWSFPAYFWLYVIGPGDSAHGFGYEALASTA